MTKKVTISSDNISPKQWSVLLLELNIMKETWRPFAKLEIQGNEFKKVIKWGTQGMMQKSNHGGTIGKIYDHVVSIIRWNSGQETSGVYNTGECDGMSSICGRSSPINFNIQRIWPNRQSNRSRMVS